MDEGLGLEDTFLRGPGMVSGFWGVGQRELGAFGLGLLGSRLYSKPEGPREELE